MLSKLPETESAAQAHRERVVYQRFVEPFKHPMSKQIHSQQGHQVRKGPMELGSELKEPKDQHRNQCCPNLNPHSIGAGSHKGLDLEVLFQL
jgi:hypothetical protein